ncbi:hypothetical protein [Salinisphaera hydrothermalis]|uniref:Uncharacterized protein n=1 Tax=Salinisphaera hydrothermalis (strain C41B8) TaxID=1304275 RepID=A0A084INR3_SALHC|nr:hypothetical protein [Salinisphaera hydrothermalis]KEZ78347.1 hypothetical protein C41B8_05578 [Salinisphaera hydrothermalis C41B8]
MNTHNPIVTQAVREAGGQTAVARALNLHQPTVFKWTRVGLPRTEWTGETNYAATICDMANANPDRSRRWTKDVLRTREVEPIEGVSA